MRSIGAKRVFLALCVSEAAVFVTVVSLYHAASHVDVSSFLYSRAGILFLCSLMTMALSLTLIIAVIRSNGVNKRTMALISAMNIFVFLLTIGSMEIGIRLLAKSTLTGETFRGMHLEPRKWYQVKGHYKAVVERMAQAGPFVIYDPFLGWTLAPSSQNETGERISSAEGLRSPRVGMRFSDRHTRHSGVSLKPSSIRIALIGDSMTFGNEVLCEHSWAHMLEDTLGPAVQILNFGVSGYGLNQVLLRYHKDVRPWKPQMVIIGITSLEIKRLTWLYKFLNPYWSGDPFVYPRLVLRNGKFSHINDPPIRPEEIIIHTSVKDLPYIELDDNYRRLDWERDGFWLPLQQSYFFRFLTSIKPPAKLDKMGSSDEEMMVLSQHLLKSLIQEVQEDGAIPLVIHLPYEYELENLTKNASYVPLSLHTLHNSNIDYIDSAPCLLEAKATHEYMPQGHYSPKANAVIARCLTAIVRDKLGVMKH